MEEFGTELLEFALAIVTADSHDANGPQRGTASYYVTSLCLNRSIVVPRSVCGHMLNPC